MSYILCYNFLLSVSTSKFIIIESFSVHFFVLEKCLMPEFRCLMPEFSSSFDYFRIFSPTLSRIRNDYSRILPVGDEEEFLVSSKYINRNHSHVPGN